jgi:hypothetical protein
MFNVEISMINYEDWDITLLHNKFSCSLLSEIDNAVFYANVTPAKHSEFIQSICVESAEDNEMFKI